MSHFFSIKTYKVPESQDPTTQSPLFTEYEYVIYRKDDNNSHIIEVERGDRSTIWSHSESQAKRRCQELDYLSSAMEEVKIGAQTWAKKDLQVFKFRNGDLIPIVQDRVKWYKLETAAMCINPDTGKAFYNWWAVNDPRGLAPDGWLIPDNDDWDELIEFLGGEDIAGVKMKHRKKWDGSNDSKFSALSSGMRNGYNGNFYVEGYRGYWWSASPSGTSSAWFRMLGSDYSGINSSTFDASHGFSVRCIKWK